jgi:hypothetical protein
MFAALLLPLVLLAMVCVLLPMCAAHDQTEPDVIFTGGNVYTLDATGTRAEALAAKDGSIVAIGTDKKISALAGAKTQTVALKGQTVLPGFIDAHGHLAGLGSLKNGQKAGRKDRIHKLGQSRQAKGRRPDRLGHRLRIRRQRRPQAVTRVFLKWRMRLRKVCDFGPGQ